MLKKFIVLFLTFSWLVFFPMSAKAQLEVPENSVPPDSTYSPLEVPPDAVPPSSSSSSSSTSPDSENLRYYNMPSASTSTDIYGSQCATGQTGTGAQTGCIHTNDTNILSGQCMAHYSQAYCSSMPDYLNRMASECAQLDPPSGINCNMIAQNGIYGREAAAYANYIESNLYGTNTAAAAAPASGMLIPVGLGGLPDPAGGIKQILTTFLDWLLGIIGIIALIAFAISGIQYFMAAGNEKNIETAKRNMTYSIIGIVVAISGFVIIRAVDYALNATNSLF